MTPSDLAAEILRHTALYAKGVPAISDEEFDLLVAQLRHLDPGNPVLNHLGKPGQVAHQEAMLSLDKTYTVQGVEDYLKYVKGPVLAMPKYDGIAVSLLYYNNSLLRAATRGDGIRGEDITKHAHRAGVPATLSKSLPSWTWIEIRGELILPKTVTVETNRRNVAAGILGRSDAEGAEALHLVVYDVRLGSTEVYRELHQLLDWAGANGFRTADYNICHGPGLGQESLDRIAARVQAQPYDTDGVVFTVDNVSERARFGATSHHPRWAIAYKFQGESAVTTLTRIEWQVGKSGIITPVAVVEPVHLSGVTVTRSTVHNVARLRELGLAPGAQVLMTRRGGVIPHIEKRVDEGAAVDFAPTVCPSCHKPVGGHSVRDGEPVCPEPAKCQDVIAARLEHFMKTIGVDGFGPVLATEVTYHHSAREPADLYLMSPTQVTYAVYAALEKKRALPLDVALQAMAVEGLGESLSRKLAQRLGTVEAVLAAGPQGFEAAGANARVFVNFREQASVLKNLLSVGVAIMPAEIPGATGVFAGKSVVFTGELKKYTRPVAQKLVRERGGETPAGMSKKVDILVLGDGTEGTTKHQKALKLGTTCLTETQFIAMLGEVTAVRGPAVGFGSATIDNGSEKRR